MFFTAVYLKGIIITTSRREEAIIANAVTGATVATTEKSATLSGGQGEIALSSCPFSFLRRKPMNRCFLVLCILASVASAHIGTRVFPFYELTDEMLETIDIHDGSVEEWYQIGEPSMTLLDFKTPYGLDPSDLDFRIWLAWHEESNRIYAAITVIDDIYYNEHNHSRDDAPGNNIFFYDSILLTLDADHSGGTGRKERFNYAHEELLELYGSTQWYSVIAQTVSGPTIDNDIRISQENPLRNSIGTPDPWMIFPPYGDAGGLVEGEKTSSQRDRDVCHAV